jgi:ABC-type Fe3+/spermidine/putrescine transport system ATPase subunit
LLDEPLSALDANLRRQMQSELKALQREVGISFVFVTHDQDEAMALSDRIALLRDGLLEQIASPSEIYNRPATAYCAAFIGKTNLVRSEIRNGQVNAGALRWKAAQPDGSLVFSIRPESIRVATGATQNGYVRFAARIAQQMFQGPTRVVSLECGDGTRLEARLRGDADLGGQSEFEFDAADAIAVKESA